MEKAPVIVEEIEDPTAVALVAAPVSAAPVAAPTAIGGSSQIKMLAGQRVAFRNIN